MRLDWLTWGELDKLYKTAAEFSGFFGKEDEDPQKDGRWFRQVEPDRFDLCVGHGFLRHVPAVLLVGRGEIVSENEYYLNRRYNNVAGRNEWRQSVHIPRYRERGKIRDVENIPFSYAIQEECPKGRKVLSLFPASNCSQKRTMAELYWNTVDNFSRLSSGRGLAIAMTKNSEMLPSFYFGRIYHWLAMYEDKETEGSRSKKEKHQLRSQKRAAVSGVIDVLAVLKKSRLVEDSGLRTELFFKHFGGTDLVYDGQTRQFCLPLGGMGVFPQFYGAAYWVWNILMHSANYSPTWAVRETEKWREAFEKYAPQELKPAFYRGFYLNLLERGLAALLVDLPRRRSPLNVSKNSQRRHVEKIFVAVLRGTLKSLREEWEAAEALAVLNEIYAKI